MKATKVICIITAVMALICIAVAAFMPGARHHFFTALICAFLSVIQFHEYKKEKAFNEYFNKKR